MRRYTTHSAVLVWPVNNNRLMVLRPLASPWWRYRLILVVPAPRLLSSARAQLATRPASAQQQAVIGHRSSRGVWPLYLLFPGLSLTRVAGRIVLETLATMY